MNFQQLPYLPAILLAFVGFVGLVVYLERRFFGLIQKYWFYRRSAFSYLSSLCLLLGMGGLLGSLLDVRGPEEKVKTRLPTDRTIILIDTSASMLAEDVKPSRLQKAALIAKHFARRAAGHQLSVVAFSEIQKKIVPFTNDLDLIDARLDSLKNLRNQYGSSALSIAIQESVQYFREIEGNPRGNILVLTDGEETAGGIDIKIPEEIHVALVGVGTKQGGRIPLDDGRGFRFGYKKDRGQDVITKLNETFFQRVASDLPSAKYWLTNSYSLPSDEILEFFTSEKNKGLEQQDMVIRPVLMEWIVVPALCLFILAYFLKALRVFSLGLLLVVLPVRADEEKQLPPEVVTKLTELKEGKLSTLEKLKLADDLHRNESSPEALALYEESLGRSNIDTSLPPETYLNYGTVLLESGRIDEGLDVYERLHSTLPKDSPEAKKLKEIMDKNVLTVLKKKEEQKKKEQQKKDQEEKDKKDGKDKKDQQGEGKEGKQGQPNQQDNQPGKPDEKSGGEQDKKQEKKEQGEGQEKDKENSDPQKDKDEKKGEGEEEKPEAAPGQPEAGDQGEGKPKPQKKLAPKLKQLMSDDRQLQIKMIENGTRDLNKRKSRGSKDW